MGGGYEFKETSSPENETMRMRMLAALSLTLCCLSLSPAVASGNAQTGEKIAKAKCAVCHTFTANDAANDHKVGPALFGIALRAPASLPDFSYSRSLQDSAATFAWDEETLSAYLADPTAFLRDRSGDSDTRSKMTFKLSSASDRSDVTAYLLGLR